MTSHTRKRVVIGSAFRNASHYLTRYFSQVALLAQQGADRYEFRVHAVEGDSVDDTARQLCHVAGMFGIHCTMVECCHGQPWFGSTEAPDRMAALSKVGNAILDGATPDDHFMIYVESDLLWQPRVMLHALETLDHYVGFDSISPMTFAGDAFYDIWGFRGLDGQRFSPFAPYHPSMLSASDPTKYNEVTEVASVGSCLVMEAYLAVCKRARMNNGALVEFCHNARSLGYRFATLDPSWRIQHP